jgi:AmmeMemoRadiSam system protein A
MMTDKEKATLLKTARATIEARLEGGTPEYEGPDQSLLEPRALFVTLRTDGKLRGCIGTLEASDPLFEAVKEFSISSAFHDPRFPPLRENELPELSIEISVLSPLKKVESFDEIEIGKHGLYAKKGFHSGVLLPQVPVEQRWNKTQFLQNTCRKAGLPVDSWQNGGVVFYSFSAEVFGEDQ